MDEPLKDYKTYKLSETKHIIKNYGRAILGFIIKNKELIIYLCNNGINKNLQNNDGNTAFMISAYYGYNEIVLMLFYDFNVDINIKNHKGNNALLLASIQNKEYMVQTLVLLLDMDVNETNNDNETALIIASKYGYTLVADTLINKFIDT